MSIRDKCGVFAILGDADRLRDCAFGVYSLQHRGQEGYGVVAFDEDSLGSFYSNGLVDVNSILSSGVYGSVCIGHVRYSTSGSKDHYSLFQPLQINFSGSEKAVIAYNGNIMNADEIRSDLQNKGAVFKSDIDTEVLGKLIEISSGRDVVERINKAFTMYKLKGAFSLVLITKDFMLGIKDIHGIRPLVLGKKDNTYVLASETCALDIIRAEYVRKIDPGEYILIHKKDRAMKTGCIYPNPKEKACVFEKIYFSRADSRSSYETSMYSIRRKLGYQLAYEETEQLSADIVVPIPESGVPGALGYSDYTGIPVELAIVRNHNAQRTFIEPEPGVRSLKVHLKYNINKLLFKGKSVVLVDDSLVRGFTISEVVKKLRAAWVREVHLRVMSPPIAHSCHYGIDTPEKGDLFAAKFAGEELRDILDLDSIRFMSIEGMYRATQGQESSCDACFTGNYLHDED